MANALKAVTTAIQCRLVDEHDLPIAGAHVRLAPAPSEKDSAGDTSVETAPDGYFQLPPPSVDIGSYGPRAKLEVTFRDESKKDVTVDLSAPGLSVVTVKTPRPRTKLAFIRDMGQLKRLKLSDEVNRQAERDLDAGRTVVIPDHFVSDGRRQYTGYYACDNRTGDYAAVMEDGLCGSSAFDQVLADRPQVLKAIKAMIESPGPVMAGGAFNAYRGAVISWWVYCSCRTGGDSHKQAVLDTLAAMQAWSNAMDLGSAVGNATSGQVGSQLGGLLNKGGLNVSGDAQKLAFDLGYVGGTLYLAQKLEGSDAE
jgi:hypothetical protein